MSATKPNKTWNRLNPTYKGKVQYLWICVYSEAESRPNETFP
ncbi:hypothetical protein D1AOALGA4SA_5755 [Olavius algarvensis Delta 1 endosymbiont]|nr:hypothetical protein D1AOALGA4SA_5755 [Olavius algarvensis Delta 1 endosymbiont]